MKRLNEIWSRGRGALAAAAVVGAVAACAEQTPTSIGTDVLPGSPITVQIEIPWESFGSNLQVFGGYGRPSDIGSGVVATDFAGVLNARTLIRFGAYPQSATVLDTTGTNVTDTDLTFVGGELVAVFNRRASTSTDPVTLTLGAMQESWHRASASWASAVDTIGGVLPWSTPGGGDVSPLDTATWTPASGDTVFFALDSAEVATWADTAAARRGARIDLVTPDRRLQISTILLRLSARPSVRPDTIIQVVVPDREATFIYDPVPTAPASGMRVGGAPAWRTVFDLSLPTQLTGPPELCQAVGCPVTLAPEQVSYAALVLTTARSEAAYQPLDTLGLDVREVLSRAALPKAPLGSALIASPGRRVPASAFGDGEGATVEIPITPVARNLVAVVDPDTQIPYPNTLALLSTFEPSSLAYASFYGPGDPRAPMLRLVVTVGPSVELP